MRDPSKDSRRMRQGFVDLIPSSSENLLASYIINGFSSWFVLVRPRNLVSLRKIGSIDNFGELIVPSSDLVGPMIILRGLFRFILVPEGSCVVKT